MGKVDKISSYNSTKGVAYYGEKKLINARKTANEMYFKQHFSKNMIAKKLKMSKKFVIKWTESPTQDFTEDNRGWKKGRRRKWSRDDEKRVKRIFLALKKDPSEFYLGATAIEHEWRLRYPDIEIPPLRTIGRILADLGLSGKRKKDRHKGAARYLCYPEYTIYTLLGGRVLEADFIGKKYVTGRTEPINFIGFSFKKEPRFRYYERVEAQSTDSFIEKCGYFFDKFEKPDFIKVDNCLAAIGSSFGKRNISRTMRFLFDHQVVPIFAVPKKPFSQASIEGNNSVFARLFWNKTDFKSIKGIDKKLECFNQSSQRYTGYNPPKTAKERNEKFIPKVYFIRQVRENKEQKTAFIDILNEKISLPGDYINYFVLAEWRLDEEMMYIYFEKEKESIMVDKIPFTINPRTKKNISKW